MRANRVRDAWAAGRAVINGWCGIPSSFSAELMANLGWDSLVVDMQHGVVDYQMMVTMFQGISTTDATPMVRVPWNDPAHIMKALDAVYVGPSDLSITMGLPPGLDKTDARMIANLKKILDGCRRHGVKAGIHTGGPAYAKRMIEMGYNFTTIMGDAALLRMAASQVLQQMREGAPAARSTGPY